MDNIKIKFIEESDIKLDRPTSGMHHNNAAAIRVCIFEDVKNGIIIISKNGRSQLHNKEICQKIYQNNNNINEENKILRKELKNNGCVYLDGIGRL